MSRSRDIWFCAGLVLVFPIRELNSTRGVDAHHLIFKITSTDSLKLSDGMYLFIMITTWPGLRNVTLRGMWTVL